MLGMLLYDATAVLKDINVPALVVAGDKESVCRPEASERMRRDIPGAQLTQLVPAKHMGLIEHHTLFAQIVKRFSSLWLPTATK
jgi:pimeloyl-ACP methyl ester carboxylesterase